MSSAARNYKIPLELEKEIRDEQSESRATESSQTNNNTRDEIQEIKKIIKQESQIVRTWRWVVIIAMTLVAGAVTVATYFFLSREEHDDFENAFDQLALTMIESSRFTATTLHSTCEDFSDVLTSAASQSKSEWPFFTMPNMNVHGANLRKQLDSVGFWITPRVTEAQKQNWTSYVLQNSGWYNQQFSPWIFYYDDETSSNVFEYGPGPYYPVWQIDPLPVYSLVNYDMGTTALTDEIEPVRILQEATVGRVLDNTELIDVFPSITNVTNREDEPHSTYIQPIFDSFNETSRTIVAYISVFLRWGQYFSNKLPDNARGIHLVLESTCNKPVTWRMEGGSALFIGQGDLHDTAYDSYRVTSPFNTYRNTKLATEVGACLFTLHVYPSSDFEENYRSNTPIITTIVVGAVFISIIAAFLAYDNFQRKRNSKVISNAAKSNALVTSLFPSNVRDRLLQPVEANENASKATHTFLTRKGQLQNFLDTNAKPDGGAVDTADRPIADLFLETTIMFADICGFTAWSSVREPSQVFALLESVFTALDAIAQKRRIFKVETVGDCYVAVAGLPEARKDHALAMSRFAFETLRTVHEVTKRLELTLGPDTGDLGVRIGLHSGVVTGGVLRGERARFQLFGDTVNTTARIESTGQTNRIHMSKDTADLLIQAGKPHWVQPRSDLVSAKGKGTMQTYWLEDASSSGAAPTQLCESTKDMWANAEVTDSKTDRLIDWQVDVFSRLLKQVIARRNASSNLEDAESQSTATVPFHWTSAPDKTCLDEVKEIIMLPEFDAQAARTQENPDEIVLDQKVIKQLRSYITAVAHMYRNNDFHSFEHACHVTMSVTKLLSRIVMPSDLEYAKPETTNPDDKNQLQRSIASTLHDHTYGITSDPLTQFSLVFSALIHDVDHTGVPNTTLVKENTSLATLYRNKSVAEQNSVDLAWDLLQGDEYQDLCQCIYSSKSEFDRFRQLLVQAVLATDIADKELKTLRNARWDNAFAEDCKEESPRDTVNRKATIVIEHLIQASDVAHTMQHWHVYRKWNENFFRECYQAYKDGRADKDPSLNWYEGELGFFDFYIIPLAKKLKKCGVFGVSSDEYLNYAVQNRQEWEDRGREVIEEMIHSIQQSESAGHDQQQSVSGSLQPSPIERFTDEL